MKNFYLFRAYQDVDEFSQIIQGWDLDFLQLDKGEFKADLLQVTTANSLLSHSRFNRSFDQRGSAPPGMWTFALFSERSTPIIWHGREITNSTMVIYRPGSEIECVSRPGFEVYTLSYTEDHLDRICAKLRLPEVNKLADSCDYFDFDGEHLAVERILLRNVIYGLKTNSAYLKDGQFKPYLERELPETILLNMSAPGKSARIQNGKRQNAIKKIKDYLAEHPHEPVSISTLCSISQVSERTLQYAFKEHFGLSPKSYLKRFRLYGVRKELLQSNPGKTTVIDIASVWGFWHMGQFAADYRNLFGELPSDTLQRS